MGPGKLSNLASLSIVLLFLGLSQGNAFAQEWFGEMLKGEKRLSEKNIFEIQRRADEYFKYAEQEYYSRYFKLDDYPELQYKNIRQYISCKRWEEYWLNHVDNNNASRQIIRISK